MGRRRACWRVVKHRTRREEVHLTLDSVYLLVSNDLVAIMHIVQQRFSFHYSVLKT